VLELISALKNEITVNAIYHDLHFMGRFFNSLGTPATREVAGVLSLCVIPYTSLFVYESDRQMQRINPEFAATLSANTRNILRTSRHSLKLFDDTGRGGIDGVKSYFTDEIRESQRVAFGGSKYVPFTHVWAKDFGLYLYDEEVILTTDLAIFTAGLDTKSKFRASVLGKVLHEVAVEYGAYLATWGVQPGAAYSFASEIRSDRLVTIDAKGAKYFCEVFNGAARPDINMLLSAFRSLITFTDKVLTLDASQESRATIFKIRYLVAYQVRVALNQIADTWGDDLTPYSVMAIRQIVDHPESSLFDARGFRNDLMHYCPSAKIDDSVLTVDPDKLYGLPEVYFDAAPLDIIGQRLDLWLSSAVNVMREWEK
jgi:hypothetical protein